MQDDNKLEIQYECKEEGEYLKWEVSIPKYTLRAVDDIGLRPISAAEFVLGTGILATTESMDNMPAPAPNGHQVDFIETDATELEIHSLVLSLAYSLYCIWCVDSGQGETTH